MNRLRAQVLAASENLKLTRACRSAGPTSAAAAAASGMQHDRHDEEEEDGVHIDVDAVSDDMSAITAETFFSTSLKVLCQVSERLWKGGFLAECWTDWSKLRHYYALLDLYFRVRPLVQ